MQDTSHIKKALIRESRKRLLRKWRRKKREADRKGEHYLAIAYQSCIDDLSHEGQLE
jgi:hypothetical protein